MAEGAPLLRGEVDNGEAQLRPAERARHGRCAPGFFAKQEAELRIITTNFMHRII